MGSVTHSLVLLCSGQGRRGNFTCDPSDFVRRRLRTDFVCRSAPSRVGTATSIGTSVRGSHPVSQLVYKSMNFKGARMTVHTTFGTISSGGRITILIPAAMLTFRRCRAFSRQLGSFPYQVRCVDQTHATGRVERALGSLGRKGVGVVVNARQVIKGSIAFGSLNLLVVSRRRGFNMSIGRGLHRLGTGISALAVATAPVPHALRFSLVKTHSLSDVAAPPPGHCPIRARMRHFGPSVVQRTVGFRVDHGKRIFFVGGHVRGVCRVRTLIGHRIPSTHVTINRKRVRPRGLRGVVLSFIGCRCSMLVTADVIRDNVSMPGTGAVVVGGTRRFKLSSLRRLHNHIKQDGQGTFYCLLSPPLSDLARRTHHHLRTVRGFSRLKDNVRVTVRSLSVQNTNGVLNTRRDNFVTSLNCRACRGVLRRTISRLGTRRFTSLCSGTARGHPSANDRCIHRACVRDSLRLVFPPACVPGSSRHISLCHRLSGVRRRHSVLTFARHLGSHFKGIPGRKGRLVHIIHLHHVTGALNVRGMVLGGKRVDVFLIAGPRDPCCRDRTFSGLLNFVRGRPHRYALHRRGKGHDVIVGGMPAMRITYGCLSRVKGMRVRGWVV